MFYESFVPLYQVTRNHIPEDCMQYSEYCVNFLQLLPISETSFYWGLNALLLLLLLLLCTLSRASWGRCPRGVVSFADLVR